MEKGKEKPEKGEDFQRRKKIKGKIHWAWGGRKETRKLLHHRGRTPSDEKGKKN